MMPVVTVHQAAGAVGGQVLPGAVEVTVLVRAPLPVSGLVTVTE